MENHLYNIKDISNNNVNSNTNIDELINNINKKLEEKLITENFKLHIGKLIESKQNIFHIANYYNIDSNKYNKDDKDKINELYMLVAKFELTASNSNIVTKRRQLWEFTRILKSDNYLSQFVKIDL